jgi:hypothetical protein
MAVNRSKITPASLLSERGRDIDMAYDRDPREQAFSIVRDLMRESQRYSPGIEPGMLMPILEKLIKERDYWQRECEGARRYMSRISAVDMSNSLGTYSVPPGYELVFDAAQNVTSMRPKGAAKQIAKPADPPATPADPIRDRMSGLDFEDDKPKE